MSLPPAVRHDVAFRLLESVEPDIAQGVAAEGWLNTVAAAAFDAFKADPKRVVTKEDVRAGFDAASLDRATRDRVNYTPEADEHLHEIHGWLSSASPDVARRYLRAFLHHVEGMSAYFLADRVRDDVRSGLRTTTFQGRTLVVYEGPRQSNGFVTTIVAVFHPRSGASADGDS